MVPMTLELKSAQQEFAHLDVENKCRKPSGEAFTPPLHPNFPPTDNAHLNRPLFKKGLPYIFVTLSRDRYLKLSNITIIKIIARLQPALHPRFVTPAIAAAVNNNHHDLKVALMSFQYGDDNGDHDKGDPDKGEHSIHIQGEVLLSHYGTLQKNQAGQNVGFPEAPSPPNSCLYNLSSCFHPLKLQLFTFLTKSPQNLGYNNPAFSSSGLHLNTAARFSCHFHICAWIFSLLY